MMRDPHANAGDPLGIWCLSGVQVIPGDLPDGVSSILAQPQFRRDFAVQIDGYGSGRISLLVN